MVVQCPVVAPGLRHLDIADSGLKGDCVAPVSGRLLPGHATFLAEVEEYSTRPVDNAVWRNGGVVFRHPWSTSTSDALVASVL